MYPRARWMDIWLPVFAQTADEECGLRGFSGIINKLQWLYKTVNIGLDCLQGILRRKNIEIVETRLFGRGHGVAWRN
jgi:hypothetical protein